MEMGFPPAILTSMEGGRRFMRPISSFSNMNGVSSGVPAGRGSVGAGYTAKARLGRSFALPVEIHGWEVQNLDRQIL
jgi:hypothetical protein